jgi:hypothetical protein
MSPLLDFCGPLIPHTVEDETLASRRLSGSGFFLAARNP